MKRNPSVQSHSRHVRKRVGARKGRLRRALTYVHGYYRKGRS